jgi:exodeoxyribonuclease V beta subunit
VRFGNALHAALERADFARWRDWNDVQPPEGEEESILAALRAEGFGSETDQTQGLALLSALIAATLNVRLPEGLRLCELAPPDRCDEMEFHLHLAPTAIPDLITLLHAHGIVRERHGFGLRRRIEGLLTGRIDLVYRHGERFYVLDYKSNRLRAYDPTSLEVAVSDSEYDLQYVLYTLALHRWLRFRLGDDYDYTRHLGGVRYLFCRGLDPSRDDGAGIHAVCPPRELIQALDALFAGSAEAIV